MNRPTRMIRSPAVLTAIAAGAALLLAAGCDKSSPQAPAASTSVGTEIDDGIVTARVKSALLSDPDTKSSDLKVETRRGEVMLSGFVDNQSQVDRAFAITRSVEGVRQVTNKMGFKDGKATVGNAIDDGIITATVKSALLADPNISSTDIAVVTRKGETQLSGFVDNQNQIERATSLTRAVDGVRSVSNEMSIKK